MAAFGNQYDLSACSGMPAAPLLPASGQATDQVVKLRVASNCNLTVTSVGTSLGGNQSDPAIYLATTCPIADPGTTSFLDATCLGAADATGALGTESFTVPVQAATDYYLYLDGFLAAQGPYNVTLSGCTLVSSGSSDPVFEDGFEVVAGGPLCGNGSVEGIEQCDDSNVVDGDGCDHACAFEPGTPGQCALARAKWESLLSEPQPLCSWSTNQNLPPGFTPRLTAIDYQGIIPALYDSYPNSAFGVSHYVNAGSYINQCGPLGPELAFEVYSQWYLDAVDPTNPVKDQINCGEVFWIDFCDRIGLSRGTFPQVGAGTYQSPIPPIRIRL